MSKIMQGPFDNLLRIEDADISKGIVVYQFNGTGNILLGYVIGVEGGFVLIDTSGEIISKTYATLSDMIGSGTEYIGEALQFHQIL